MSKWIGVEDSLPEVRQEVLVFCKWDDSPLIAFHDGNYWTEKCDNLEVIGDACATTEIQKIGDKDTGCEITHWMPLPELPK